MTTAAPAFADLPPELLAQAAEIPDLRLRLAQFIRGEVAQHSRRRGHIRPLAKELVQAALREAGTRGPLTADEQSEARREFAALYAQLMTRLS